MLHAVRLKGVADDKAVATRFGLDPGVVSETLLDQQAYGWVTWSEFAGHGGWSMTDRGRAENERRLADELDSWQHGDARTEVAEVYDEFLPLNARLRTAVTEWQIKPTSEDPLAANAHDDLVWDQNVVAELGVLDTDLVRLTARLSGVLKRFDGYDARFGAALSRVLHGDPTWVDRSGADSCHTVWFELHEDLLATLGRPRVG